jgi:ribosomal-protein-alanine N-acetyltransferase
VETKEKKLIIRPMTEADIDAVDDLACRALPDPWPKYTYVQELKNEFAFLFVLTYADVILGFSHFWITFDSATIVKFAIHPAAQGKGLGSLLMAHLIERVSLLEEVKAITLEVRTSNDKAMHLYLKHGFNVMTKKRKYYEDGEDAYYMVKVLKE